MPAQRQPTAVLELRGAFKKDPQAPIVAFDVDEFWLDAK